MEEPFTRRIERNEIRSDAVETRSWTIHARRDMTTMVYTVALRREGLYPTYFFAVRVLKIRGATYSSSR